MRYLTAFAGTPGRRVFVSLIAPRHPRALLLVVHGAGSYLGPYLPFAWEMAARGVAAALLDLPGHGLSDGVPAHTRSYRSYLEAIGDALSWACAACPAPATFLAGESYGAILALLYTATCRAPAPGGPSPGDGVAGLVLSAPAFRVAAAPDRALAAVRALARLVPRLRLPRGIPPAVTRHPEAGEIVRRDPLLNRRLSAAYITELLRAAEEATRLAPRLGVPVLFLIAGDDMVVDNRASRQAFGHWGGSDREWEEFPGLAHALMLEDPEGMAERVSRWILGRLPTDPA